MSVHRCLRRHVDKDVCMRACVYVCMCICRYVCRCASVCMHAWVSGCDIGMYGTHRKLMDLLRISTHVAYITGSITTSRTHEMGQDVDIDKIQAIREA